MPPRKGVQIPQPDPSRTTEVRHGPNVILRAGDIVRVRPSKPGLHDGFRAKFLYAETDRGGLYYSLRTIVIESGKAQYGAVRFLKPERVKGRTQTVG